jgi:hypothetical protein
MFSLYRRFQFPDLSPPRRSSAERWSEREEHPDLGPGCRAGPQFLEVMTGA